VDAFDDLWRYIVNNQKHYESHNDIVKPWIPPAALVATLLTTSPACSADPAAASAPPASSQFALADALVSTIQELQGPEGQKLDLITRFDQYVSFRHTPETTQKLTRLFGTTRPYTFARLPNTKNQIAYRATLAPFSQPSQDGSRTEWTELSVKLELDKAARTLALQGNWPSLLVQDKNIRFSARELSLASKQKRRVGDVWFGDSDLKIGSLQFDAASAHLSTTLDDVHAASSVNERANAIEIRHNLTVKSIAVSGERIDGFKLSARLTNIDSATMAELSASGKEVLALLAAKPWADAIRPMLNTLAKAAIERASAIEIDELSARFRGNKASVVGRLSLDGAIEPSLELIPAVLKKLNARFELTVPVAMVQAIASASARKQMSPQQKLLTSKESAAQTDGSKAYVLLGKLVGNGYARVENGVVRSTIEFKGGVLRLLGQEVSWAALRQLAAAEPGTQAGTAAPAPAAAAPGLPAPAAPPVPAPAEPVMVIITAPAATDDGPFKRERRIDGTCKMPDYPEEVVRLDLPLLVSVRFFVDTDGRVRNLTLTQSSPWSWYDRAVLKAAALCAFVPARLDGEPIKVPRTLYVVRESKSARP
jgi:TonB family protein